MFSGLMNDTNSSFISNRKVTGGGGCYLVSFAKAYFYSSQFIWNFASVMGGAIGLTQDCFVFMQKVLVLGCSSDKGGVFLATEKASLLIKDSNFTGNFANSGGVLHALENYNSSISIISSFFLLNKGGDNLFNLMVSNAEVSHSVFHNNVNIIFSLTQSGINLNNVSVFNHKCMNYMFGCVINSIQSSSIVCTNMRLIYLENLKEKGNFYIEDSSSIFSNVSFEVLDSLKSIGNCFNIKNSNITIDNGSFITYAFNCIYAKNSRVLINNSYFNNSEEESVFGVKNDASIIYGSIFCESCYEFSLQNSVFLNNLMCDEGGALNILSDWKDFNLTVFLLNNSFKGNKVKDKGGAISIYNANGNIFNCSFINNQADFGAAIYFESLCKIIKNIIIRHFLK